ncbi:MAG TPA: carboxypeptidase-like regulatory domain-containing protein [Allosphingosinicella sp.]|nr:carboxypeptidase-like regulatory domain-containing protein [Allosphingosinicella sp.]
MGAIARKLLHGALAAAAMLAAPAAGAASWQPNDDDALLFDARLGQYRIGEGIRGYQTPEGVCVNLADMIVTLDVPVEIDAAKGVAEGWAFEERNRLRIDRMAGKARIGERQLELGRGAIYDAPDGWCVSAAKLSTWLGIELKPDLSNALIFISSRFKLPVELAAERRARASRVRPSQKIDLKKLPQARLEYEMWRVPSLDAVVTVGGIVDQKRGDRFERRFELFASGELAYMSVDARLSSNDRGEPTDLRVRAYRSDAEATLLGPLRATHFAIGDVASFGSALAAQTTIGRGAVVTNRPLGLQETFDRKTFRGELPSGWDAELYRNGQLLAVAQNRADGRYEFVDVPLLYGQNRFEIVLYGPQGQVRREVETVSVGAESIPPEETWYWAGISQDERDMLTLAKDHAAEGRGWRAGLGIERGLDERTSLSAQFHSLKIHHRRRHYFEGAVRRSIGPALLEVAGSVESHGGFALRSQLLGQIGETYVSAESVMARDYVSDRVEKGMTGNHVIALDHAFDLGKLVLPLHVEGRYITREDGNDSMQAGARLSATVSRISITGAVDWQRQKSRYGPDPGERLDASLLANGMIARTQLRGELRWRLAPESRFESATLIGQRPISPRSDLRAEIGYEYGLDRVRGAIGYVRRFNNLALSATAEAATDGSIAAGLNLAFSIGPDPRAGRVRVTADRLAAAGTALARVFHDDNGDGVRQYGEAYAQGVQLAVGRSPIEKLTDRRGEATINGLEPHRPVLVGIDASSIADPLTRPAGPGIVVTPRPGLAVPIDLPLVSAGEVIGTLVASGGRTLEGVDLELVDGRGIVAATTRTDFDGFFEFEGVPYGRYTVRLAKLSADAARLSPMLGRSAQVGGKSPSVRLGTVVADAAGATAIAAR